MLAPGPRHLQEERPRQQLVLILSHDVVAAALLGGIIETLGYQARFPQPTERAEESLRRVRPRICFVDCDDPCSCHTEFLGRATMRGVCIVIFGTKKALDHARAIVMAHDVEMLTMPPPLKALELLLQNAGAND